MMLKAAASYQEWSPIPPCASPCRRDRRLRRGVDPLVVTREAELAVLIAAPQEGLAVVSGVVDRMTGAALHERVVRAVEMIADEGRRRQHRDVGVPDAGRIEGLNVIVVEADRMVVAEVLVLPDHVHRADGAVARRDRGGKLVVVAVLVDRDAPVVTAQAEERRAA